MINFILWGLLCFYAFSISRFYRYLMWNNNFFSVFLSFFPFDLSFSMEKLYYEAVTLHTYMQNVLTAHHNTTIPYTTSCFLCMAPQNEMKWQKKISTRSSFAIVLLYQMRRSEKERVKHYEWIYAFQCSFRIIKQSRENQLLFCIKHSSTHMYVFVVEFGATSYTLAISFLFSSRALSLLLRLIIFFFFFVFVHLCTFYFIIYGFCTT